MIASIGVVLAAAYMLWLAKKVIFGEVKNDKVKILKDVNYSEGFVLSILVILTLFFGFYPEPIFNTISPSVNNLIDVYQFEINSKISNIN